MTTNPKEAELRDQILALRLDTWDRRGFFPDRALKQVLTREVVTAVIVKSAINPPDQTRIINDILKDAQKIFCILVHLRSVNYIDLLLQSTIRDGGLPLSKEYLEIFHFPRSLARDFWDLQWHFIAPIFKNRIQKLHPQSVLPFKEERVLREGGYGALSRVVLYRSHQELVPGGHEDGATVLVARKRLKCASTPSDTKEDFENERGPLEFLRTHSHPHIIELLGSYSLNDDYNFFFPLAQGSLGDLFEKGHDEFGIGTESFYSSIVGLSSAIDHIHNFTCQVAGTNKSFKGYHRDLKPSNILIHQGKFIIADFGLSKFKDDALTSSTIHRIGTETYLPPETSSLSRGVEFGDQTVGRGVDIWSFGCILAEIATYLLRGSEGVEEFSKKRLTKITPNVSDNSFHAGNKVKKVVKDWLDGLADSERIDPRISLLIKAVWKLLIPEREERPNARAVLEEVSALDPEAAKNMKLLPPKRATEPKQEAPHINKLVNTVPQQLSTTRPPPPNTLRSRISPSPSFLLEPSELLSDSSSPPSEPSLRSESLLLAPSSVLSGSLLSSRRNPQKH